MTATSKCPSCGKGIRLPAGSAGKKIKCGGCGEIHEILETDEGRLYLLDPVAVDESEVADRGEPEAQVPAESAPPSRRSGRGRGRSGRVRPRTSNLRKRMEKNDASAIRRARIGLLVIGLISLLVGGIFMLTAVGVGAEAAALDAQIEGLGRLPDETERAAIDSMYASSALVFISALLSLVTGLSFIGLTVWASRRPLPACQVGLGLFIAIQLLGFILVPSSAVDICGWAIRLFVGITLFDAIKAARRFEKKAAAL
jgi:hypothetical protein